MPLYSYRFLTQNMIETAILKNGTGGGAPARSEVAPYVMEKTQQRSRRQFWQKSVVANLDVDFDLTGAASNVNFDCGGIGAHHPSLGGDGIDDFTIRYAANAAGYPPGAWIDIGSVVPTNQALDVVNYFGASVTGRWVRFSLTVASAFTLGKFVIGSAALNLNALFSTLVVTRTTPQVEDGSIDGNAIVNYTGPDREHWSLSWEVIQNDRLATLEAVRALRSSSWWFDRNGVGREFRVQASKMEREHLLELPANTNYRVSMELEQEA